jgi:hypothetical protein
VYVPLTKVVPAPATHAELVLAAVEVEGVIVLVGV